MNSTPMRVAVIGLRRQGVVGAACLAEWGHQVVAADHDYERIRSLAEGRAGLSEPGLDELIQLGIKSGHLSFTNNLEAAVAGCRAVFLMHDTSVEGRDGYDLSALLRALTDMAPGLAAGVIILVTAQVPVGTTAELGKLLQQLRPDLGAHLAYAPENMPEGRALAYFCSGIAVPIHGRFLASVRCAHGRDGPVCPPWLPGRHHLLRQRVGQPVRHRGSGQSTAGHAASPGPPDRVRGTAYPRPRLLWWKPRDLQALRHLGVSAGLPTALLDGAWTSNGQVRR